MLETRPGQMAKTPVPEDSPIVGLGVRDEGALGGHERRGLVSELEEARIHEVEIPMAGTVGDDHPITLKHNAGTCETHVAIERISESGNRDVGFAPYTRENDAKHVTNNTHANRSYGTRQTAYRTRGVIDPFRNGGARAKHVRSAAAVNHPEGGLKRRRRSG